MQKSQKLEKEYFFLNWNDSKIIFGPEYMRMKSKIASKSL